MRDGGSRQRRRSYKIGPVTREGLAEQQKIADVFLAEGLIPKKLDTQALAIWQPATTVSGLQYRDGGGSTAAVLSHSAAALRAGS